MAQASKKASAGPKASKRTKAWQDRVQPDRLYPIDEAVALLNELSTVKFKESIDVSINLGVDPRKSDQVVRGATSLPAGTGKQVRVAVFAQGEAAEAAKAAGADQVGMEDLAEKVKAGQLDFDLVIASPDAMKVVGPLGQILGPRGLMPNPKLGTVTADAGAAVKSAKAGQVRYRTDKGGIVHGGIGRVGFKPAQVKQNLEALIADLKKAKPASAKGAYLKKVVLSTTMGAGIPIDQASLDI